MFADACCSALGSDALCIRRALFECSELVRSSSARPSHPLWPNWASMALSTCAETKVDRLTGRNPACTMDYTVSILLIGASTQTEFIWKAYSHRLNGGITHWENLYSKNLGCLEYLPVDNPMSIIRNIYKQATEIQFGQMCSYFIFRKGS